MNGPARPPEKFMGHRGQVHMFFGLHESLKMIEEEGLDAVFQRHTPPVAKPTRESGGARGAPTGKGPERFYGQDARPALRFGWTTVDDARGRELRSHAQDRGRSL